MTVSDATYVQKSCAYVTRGDNELLVFDGPGHEGLQIPKGTVEEAESPRETLFREVVEESGLGVLGPTRHLTSDVWIRRRSPPRRYVRHFFHSTVHEPRDNWTHTVTGDGEERGVEFDFSWVDLSTDESFALDLDDYLPLVDTMSTAHATR